MLVNLKKLSKVKLKKNFNLFRNSKFSSKFLLQYGIHLGGHLKLLAIETSSIIYGIRTLNMVINLNFTAVELVKTLKIIEGLGYTRSIVYYINSVLNFRLSFKSSFGRFNRHLFFPIYTLISSIFRKLKMLGLTKKQRLKKAKALKLRKFFLIKSGKSLLRKIFVSTKWSFGFVSNSRTFFNFAGNVLHENIKVGKVLNNYQDKIKNFVDYYPFLPSFSFIGDLKSNFWVVNELNLMQVPTASMVDTFSTKSLLSFYGIPGNGSSIDCNLLFLILMVVKYLVGFNLHVLKFSLKSCKLKTTKLIKIKKKKLFFKSMKLYNFIK